MRTVDWDLDHRSLVRRVAPRRGKPYEHRVRFGDFIACAYGMEVLADAVDVFTVHELAGAVFGHDPDSGAPLFTTRAHIVLEFAIECSLVEKCGRGNRLCSGFDPLVLIADMYGFNDRVYSDAG